jgi:predicted DsbA family dithiol-disulfide isomerase/uncharacterized membrane protein
LVLRIATLVALAASAALLVDYVAASPTFCGTGGCATVRQSGFGYVPLPGGVLLPLPVLGMMAYSTLLGLSLLPTARQRARMVPPLAFAIAFVGALLLLLQAVVIRELCAFCVVVDLCSLCVGGAALGLRGFGWDESTREELTQTFIVDPSHLMAESQRLPGVWRDDSRIYTPPNPLVSSERGVGNLRLRPWAWSLLGFLCVMAPLVWPRVRPEAPVPGPLLGYYQHGRINVVEFADFECPHCRDLHGRLKAMFGAYGDRVHFTRLHAPLPSHADARGAARGSVCAEAQGKNEPMADRLFTQRDLTPPAVRKAAAELGLDMAKFDACLADPKTDARIDADIALLESAGFEGLPTTYVGAERILGAQPDEVFRDALDAAARGEGQTGVPAWAYVGGFIALVLGIAHLGRVKPLRGRPEKKHKTIP